MGEAFKTENFPHKCNITQFFPLKMQNFPKNSIIYKKGIVMEKLSI